MRRSKPPNTRNGDPDTTCDERRPECNAYTSLR